MKKILNLFFLILLTVRYPIRVTGLEAVKKKSGEAPDRPILFLPNHQALIDPVIIMSRLYNAFTPKPLVDAGQVTHPLIRSLMNMLHAVIIPDPSTGGREAKEEVVAGLEEIVAGLKMGDNVLLYPSGRISRGRLEVIGANSGAASVIRAVPELRIVLLRIRGLWGSRFSRASGVPSLLDDIQKMTKAVLVNGLLFMPRREVRIEVVEPDDFPRRADRREINRYLEEFYNDTPDRKTEIPMYWWQGRSPIYRDEAQVEFVSQDTEGIPDSTRRLVLAKLTEVTGLGPGCLSATVV